MALFVIFFFFFQAEEGIRVKLVTGVETCALPISPRARQVFGAGGGGRTLKTGRSRAAGSGLGPPGRARTGGARRRQRRRRAPGSSEPAGNRRRRSGPAQRARWSRSSRDRPWPPPCPPRDARPARRSAGV